MSFLWHGLTEQGAQVPIQVDAQGRVIAVDGTPGVSNWERTGTTLSPAVPDDSVAVNLNGFGGDTPRIGLYPNGALIAYRDEKDDATYGKAVLNGTLQDGTRAPLVLAGPAGGGVTKEIFAVSNDGTTKIGGAIPAAPNITLNADGGADFVGKVTSASTAFADPGTTLVTKDYLTSGAASGTGTFGYWSRTGTTLSPVNTGDDVQAGGNPVQGAASGARIRNAGVVAATRTGENNLWVGSQVGRTDPTSLINADGTIKIAGTGTTSAPNISLNADGTATFQGNITAPNVTFRSADPQFYVKKSKNKDALPEYVGPELDLLAEIARLEALVRYLYETLRIAPPAGWPVWDGNDDVLRQLRR